MDICLSTSDQVLEHWSRSRIGNLQQVVSPITLLEGGITMQQVTLLQRVIITKMVNDMAAGVSCY
jgi:hypothetical protein